MLSKETLSLTRFCLCLFITLFSLFFWVEFFVVLVLFPVVVFVLHNGLGIIVTGLCDVRNTWG